MTSSKDGTLLQPSDGEPAVEKVSPLRPARLGILQYKYDKVQELTRTANAIIDKVVKGYSGELDQLVKDVEETLRAIKQNRTQISQGDLQRLVVRIPIEMYKMIDIVDMAGVEADIAKMAHKLVAADYYAKEKGTIPERTKTSELKAGDEATITDLAVHAYRRLNRRLEVASVLFDAVRKVINSKDKEVGVFGREQS